MLKFMTGSFALLWLAWQAAPPPSPAALVRRAIEVRRAQDEKGWRFTWREDKEQWRPARNGELVRERTETFDIIMLEGDTYRQLVLVDGQPLDARQRKRAEEELERARTERKKRSLRKITRTVRLGELDQVERLYDLKLAGSETVHGRPAWRLEADPKPGQKAASKEEQAQLNVRRTYWFDQEEGIELKHVETFLRATNGFQPGSEITMEYGRVGEAWLLRSIVLRFDLKALAVVRARGEARHRMYDYRRYQAESKLTTPE